MFKRLNERCPFRKASHVSTGLVFVSRLYCHVGGCVCVYGFGGMIMLTICLGKQKLANRQGNWGREASFKRGQLSLSECFIYGYQACDSERDFVERCKSWSMLKTDVRLCVCVCVRACDMNAFKIPGCIHNDIIEIGRAHV